MRVLLANLKHFYQCRYLWFAYAYIALLLCLPVLDKDLQEVLTPVWLAIAFGGILVGGTSRGVINKPFVRCLPGHMAAVRKAVFLMGLVFALLGGVLFISHWHMAVWASPTTFCAAVCLSLSIYLVSADVVLIPLMARSPLGAILFGSVFGAGMFAGAFLHSLFAPVIIRHPLWTILGSVLIGAAVWLQMGLPEWSRRLFSLSLRFNRSTASREMYAMLEGRYKRGATALAIAESLFVGRMRSSADYGTGRYIWGTFYERVGNLAAWWKWLVLVFIAVLVLSAYMGWGSIVVFLFVSWMVVPHGWPPLHSVTLVPAGRRERLLAVISLAAAIAATVGLCAAAVCTISMPLSKLMPALEIRDIPLVCRPVPLATMVVPLIAVPLFATLFLVFPRRSHLVVFMTIPILVHLASIPILIVATYLWVFHDETKWVGGLTFWIGVAVIVAWTLFGAVCVYVFGKRSLARS